jgi:hypothetical protein
MIEAIEPEAELFALAEQVDLAEKAFHDALTQQIKRLAEGGDHFAILPGAVRYYEVEQAEFLARFLRSNRR